MSLFTLTTPWSLIPLVLHHICQGHGRVLHVTPDWHQKSLRQTMDAITVKRQAWSKPLYVKLPRNTTPLAHSFLSCRRCVVSELLIAFSVVQLPFCQANPTTYRPNDFICKQLRNLAYTYFYSLVRRFSFCL
eukprot:RCo025447